MVPLDERALHAAAITPIRCRCSPQACSRTGVDTVDTHRVVLEMRDVSKTFRQQRHDVPALVGVDLGLEEGETLGLVGESGSGKSTLAKTMLGIHAPDAGGEVEIEGPWRRRADDQSLRRRAPRRADDLPESRLGAQPQLDGAPDPQAVGHEAHRAQGRRGRQAGRRAGRVVAARRSVTSTSSRASCRVVSSNASPSPAPSPAIPASSCATSRRAPSTSRCRRRSSTCSPISRPVTARATCSSRTTSAWCATSATGSRSCTSAGSWSSARPSRSSTDPTTRTPRPCCRRCRASTARSGPGSRSAARSPARPTRPPVACSTRGATGSCPACATWSSRRRSSSAPGHISKCHLDAEQLSQPRGRARIGGPCSRRLI